MANCPECGKPLPEGYKICPACGGSTVNLPDSVAAHVNLLRKKLSQEPGNTRLRIDLGSLYQSRGMLLEARDEFEKAAAAEPRDFDAHFKLAQVYVKLKQGDKAEKEFNAALHINPKSTEVLTGLFRSYFLEGKTEPAIVLGEKVLRTNPDNVEFHKLLKELYQKKGDQDMALNELLTLSTLIPEDLQVIREITLHYLEKDDVEKAAVFYGRMMNMAAGETALGIRIGEYYFDLDQPERAIEFMSPLLDRTDLDGAANSTVRAHLALAYFNQNRATEALKIADRARTIDLREIEPKIKKMLGMFYSRIGQAELTGRRPAKAAEHFAAAVYYDPEDAESARSLEKIRTETTAARASTVKKAVIVAGAAVFVVLALVLARIATRGHIVFQIDPPVPVTLSIDGKMVAGTTGMNGTMVSPVLTVGKHQVVIECDGYDKWAGAVALGPLKNTRQLVSLAPIYFALSLASIPESCDVMIDDRLAGKTPYASDRVIARRNTAVAVARENYAPWCTTFTAHKGDLVYLDTIVLKNLSGKWVGKIGKEAYAYDASFRMSLEQKDAVLSVDYYHQPVEGYTYAGKIGGAFKSGELVIQGELTYRYYDVFRWERIKRKILLKGKISDDWNRIEGNSQVDGLGDQPWWAERVK